MPADDPVPPVTGSPVDDVPALPAVPSPRVAPTGNAFIGATPPTAPPAEEELAPGVLRAQISPDAVSEPHSVEVRATVHDAAVHGSNIARAIEAAQRGQDPDLINQQLAGAASVAASGMASQIDRTRAPDDAEERLPSIDPLAATPPIGGGDERGRRQQHEAELSAEDDEGGVEQSIQQDR